MKMFARLRLMTNNRYEGILVEEMALERKDYIIWFSMFFSQPSF